MPQGEPRLPLMYWGKYVAHDNNRDGMGQFLALTRNVTKAFLEWKPTILHDLHEAQTYLYASTGTGPYNEQIDPITIDEWWLLAKTEVMEMTKRGVPGVWTYGFYDGWVPNYMFFIAHAHNAIGRFYEVQSYGPDNRDGHGRRRRRPAASGSGRIRRCRRSSGDRGTTPTSSSRRSCSRSTTSRRTRRLYLENYWLKNKRAVEQAARTARSTAG